MGLFRRRQSPPVATFGDSAPLDKALAAATAGRSATGLWRPPGPMTRADAMQLSVVNRARDLLCGVVGRAELVRWSTWGQPEGSEPRRLPAGWLDRPDPTRTRTAWTSAVLDDLFFHGFAACRVTVRGADGYPLALEHVRWVELTPPLGHPAWMGPNGPRTFPQPAREDFWTRTDPLSGKVLPFSALNMVTFESPVSPMLENTVALWLAARLDSAAARFSGTGMLPGYLAQTGGADLSQTELQELAAAWDVARENQVTPALNRYVSYTESEADPSRLQLVEGRTYQDAALARLANVPGYAVGATTPGEGMTYKTALTARFDLVDFGLSPFITALEQTLSGPDVTPTGTWVEADLSRFLRTTDLAGAPVTEGRTNAGQPA